MKKLLTLALVLTYITSAIAATDDMMGRELYGRNAAKLMPGSAHIWSRGESHVPDLIEMSPQSVVTPDVFFADLIAAFHLPSSYGYVVLRSEKDQYGYEHRRCQLTVRGIAVTDGIFLMHIKAGRVEKYNGYLPLQVSVASAASIQESPALQTALNHIGAGIYKWQVPGENEFLKKSTHDPNATYYPKGELCIIQKYTDIGSTLFHLAWKFDIYAQQPLSRDYIYIDAVSGDVLRKDCRLETANTAATATTVYRGNRAIETDSYNGSYRLQETTRGLGINTYNLQSGTSYTSAVDFTNATTTWNNVNANLDQYATDAHWGGEMTSDFYMNTFGRSSIDGSGYALNLYVHYSTNYVNAFWDGNEMNFGDGDGGRTANPLVSLDVTGHEISHGLTQYTANLNYQNESGAMNEAYSDIMGTAVEYYADSTRANWTVGEDFGSPFRSMSNPKLYQQPNTYLGQYWATGAADNGGVHTNSGVENHWYYLLSVGGTGRNDNSYSYNITGIGRAKATAIAWRMQTVYLIASSQYADARRYSIQAATDLYGACSAEVLATAEAWHAVGVGTGMSGVPTVAFSLPGSACSLPLSVTFTNQTINGASYVWHFGDGDTSAATNPTHIYTTAGTFNVKLWASGCTGNDSNTATLTISPPSAPSASADPCAGGTATLHATTTGSVQWYSSPTDTTVISTANPYTPSAQSGTVTYYVSEVVTSPSLHLGIPDNTTGTGGYLNNASRGIRFMVNQPATLQSVYMYAQSTTSVTVEYRDTNGTLLASTNVSVPANGGRVNLNMNLIPSTTTVYELGINSNSNASLYRNNTGASYPYTDASNLVSIIGNNIPAGTQTGGNPIPGYYYYFYDWEIMAPQCVSARTPISISCANGISDISSNISASVYPNPVSDKIHLSIHTLVSAPLSVSIKDILGREMVSKVYADNADLNESYDVSQWADGVYMVEIQSGAGTQTRKVTVSK